MCDIYMSLAEPSCVPSFVHFCAALTESLSKAVPLPSHFCFRSPNSLLLGFYLRKIELATLTGRAPELCGWALWPGSVSGSCPCLGRAPELCGPAFVLLLSLSWPRP